jgi:hypothetical protein
MRIKLSDYILEQSISDASASDISLEQSIAEINVRMALCESHLHQMFIMESAGSSSETGFWDKVKRLITSMGNWFRKIVIKFIGWISEKRLNHIIKRLETMPDEDKEKFQGILPSGNLYEKIEETTDNLNALADMLYSGDLVTDPNVVKDTLNSIINSSKSPEPLSDLFKYNYTDYVNHIKQMKQAIVDKKEELNKIRSKIRHKTMEDTYSVLKEVDDETAKEIYRDLKKKYNIIYSELTNNMTILFKTVKHCEKVLKDNPNVVDKIDYGTNYEQGKRLADERKAKTSSESEENDESDYSSDENQSAQDSVTENYNTNIRLLNLNCGALSRTVIKGLDICIGYNKGNGNRDSDSERLDEISDEIEQAFNDKNIDKLKSLRQQMETFQPDTNINDKQSQTWLSRILETIDILIAVASGFLPFEKNIKILDADESQINDSIETIENRYNLFHHEYLRICDKVTEIEHQREKEYESFVKTIEPNLLKCLEKSINTSTRCLEVLLNSELFSNFSIIIRVAAKKLIKSFKKKSINTLYSENERRELLYDIANDDELNDLHIKVIRELFDILLDIYKQSEKSVEIKNKIIETLKQIRSKKDLKSFIKQTVDNGGNIVNKSFLTSINIIKNFVIKYKERVLPLVPDDYKQDSDEPLQEIDELLKKLDDIKEYDVTKLNSIKTLIEEIRRKDPDSPFSDDKFLDELSKLFTKFDISENSTISAELIKKLDKIVKYISLLGNINGITNSLAKLLETADIKLIQEFIERFIIVMSIQGNYATILLGEGDFDYMKKLYHDNPIDKFENNINELNSIIDDVERMLS